MNNGRGRNFIDELVDAAQALRSKYELSCEELTRGLRSVAEAIEEHEPKPEPPKLFLVQ